MATSTMMEPREAVDVPEDVHTNIERFLDGHSRHGAVGNQQNMVMRPKPGPVPVGPTGPVVIPKGDK